METETVPQLVPRLRNFLSLHLGPLTDAEMHELVSGMVPGIPDEAAAAIASRSAGMPLYAVQNRLFSTSSK